MLYRKDFGEERGFLACADREKTKVREMGIAALSIIVPTLLSPMAAASNNTRLETRVQTPTVEYGGRGLVTDNDILKQYGLRCVVDADDFAGLNLGTTPTGEPVNPASYPRIITPKKTTNSNQPAYVPQNGSFMVQARDIFSDSLLSGIEVTVEQLSTGNKWTLYTGVNGEADFSGLAAGMPNIQDYKLLKVSPNPFGNTARVLGAEQGKVSVYDMQGRLMGRFQDLIRGNELPEGAYVITDGVRSAVGVKSNSSRSTGRARAMSPQGSQTYAGSEYRITFRDPSNNHWESTAYTRLNEGSLQVMRRGLVPIGFDMTSEGFFHDVARERGGGQIARFACNPNLDSIYVFNPQEEVAVPRFYIDVRPALNSDSTFTDVPQAHVDSLVNILLNDFGSITSGYIVPGVNTLLEIGTNPPVDTLDTGGVVPKPNTFLWFWKNTSFTGFNALFMDDYTNRVTAAYAGMKTSIDLSVYSPGTGYSMAIPWQELVNGLGTGDIENPEAAPDTSVWSNGQQFWPRRPTKGDVEVLLVFLERSLKNDEPDVDFKPRPFRP